MKITYSKRRTRNYIPYIDVYVDGNINPKWRLEKVSFWSAYGISSGALISNKFLETPTYSLRKAKKWLERMVQDDK